VGGEEADGLDQPKCHTLASILKDGGVDEERWSSLTLGGLYGPCEQEKDAREQALKQEIKDMNRVSRKRGACRIPPISVAE
jgi:hypothetical protein